MRIIFENIEWLLSGVGITVIIFALNFIKNVKAKHTYYWKPTTPLVNQHDTKNISSYPKNPKFDFNSGDFSGGWVSGEESFLLMIQKFILTDRYKYQIYDDNYGIEEAQSIFIVKGKEEFERQCSNIADHLIDFFSEWIREIYAIYRRKDKLFIEMKVKGKPETLVCVVPDIHKKQTIDDKT